MKRWRYILLAFAFAAAMTWVAVQPRGKSVSVVVQGFATNAFGGLECVLLVTNATREQFAVHMQAQTRSPSGWVPVKGGFYEDPDLPALSQRTLSFPLPTPPSSRWRVVLQCREQDPANYTGIAWLERRVHSFLLGVYPKYYFFSPEMPPDPAVQLTGARA